MVFRRLGFRGLGLRVLGVGAVMVFWGLGFGVWGTCRGIVVLGVYVLGLKTLGAFGL